jgi:galactan 5-O-arabinofuranosyltransferase
MGVERVPNERLSLEVLVSLGVSAAFIVSCLGVRIDASERVGQVSALAAVELRFVLFALALVAALVVAARVRGGAHFALSSRLVCAAIAGLASATIAGGIVVMLRGTPYGLGAKIGDSSVLAMWAHQLQIGEKIPTLYPPLQLHLLAWISDGLGINVAYAIKQFQLLGILVVGPAAYGCWRLLLRPAWALGIGVVAALPLIDPYRPYPFLSLVVFVPLALRFLEILRDSPGWTKPRLLQAGTLLGLGLGVVCLLYSGWFTWSAPGFLVAAAIMFPWRRAPRNGALFCVVAAAMFAVVIAHYVIGVLDAPPIRDGFVYFDSKVEPAYIAMWHGDLPGVVERLGLWPPAGELAGVGVFTILLVIGFGVSNTLGRGRTIVAGVTSFMLGTWLLRFWYAEHMWKTGLVQLYPRTTAELLYCSLILCGYAVFLVIERARRANDGPLRTPSAMIGGASAVLLLLGFSASATLDKWMPKVDERDLGNLAYRALKTPRDKAKNYALGASVEGSTSVEAEGWSKDQLVDGNLQTGYSSQLSATEDHEEWVVVTLPTTRTFSRVILEASSQASSDGFPLDFTIETWSGDHWVERASRRDYFPTYGPEIFAFSQPETTDRIRIRATKLSAVEPVGTIGRGYAFRIREIEVYR